jgi:hypothetical protein
MYRAKARIFGLTDIKNEIDSELKKQHGIDVRSKSDRLGSQINKLTNMYSNLQNISEKKYREKFRDVVRLGLRLNNVKT